MSFNYKDLTYIRAALQCYGANLAETTELECDEDEYSEIQNDILYVSRLMGLVNTLIEEWESKKPSLNLVND